jgi:hypothetical protein
MAELARDTILGLVAPHLSAAGRQFEGAVSVVQSVVHLEDARSRALAELAEDLVAFSDIWMVKSNRHSHPSPG